MFGMFGSSKGEWEYSDLPTPVKKEEYEAVASDALADRRVLMSEKGWDTVKNTGDPDDVIVEKKDIDDSGVAAVRVTGFVKLTEGRTLRDLAHQLFSPTKEFQCRLYESVIEYKRLKKVTTSISVGRTVGEATGISNREFVALRTIEQSGDGYLIAIQSINDADYPFDSNCVRGTFRVGYELTPVTDNIVQIRSVEHVNPKGWVPGMIINTFISAAGGWIDRI
jgi:START domain